MVPAIGCPGSDCVTCGSRGEVVAARNNCRRRSKRGRWRRRSSSRRRGRRGSWRCGSQLSIREGILLRSTIDDHAPVGPGSHVLAKYRRRVVVVAHINRYDAWIGLQRQRADYVRQRIVSQPGYTVVDGFTRMHLVARRAWTGGLATGCYSRSFVVPSGKECPPVADRKVRLPLGFGRIGVGVQLEWRAKGRATVGGANVKDIAWVAAGLSGINVANDVVVRGRFTPAHVSPVSRAGVHRTEVTRRCTASADECGASISVGKSRAAIRGTIDHVSAVGSAAASAAIAAVFVHTGDVDVAIDFVDRDLHVSNKDGSGGNWEIHLPTPGDTVVSRAHNRDGRPSNIKVVPRHVHSPEEGRSRVVIRDAGFSIVAAAAMNAVMRPAVRVRGIGGLVAAHATATARCIDPDGEPDASWFVVQKNRITLSTGEGALTVRPGDAGESDAAVSGARYAGDVDWTGVATS